MSKPESKLQIRIRKTLERYFRGSFWFKVHGGPFQMAGLPDLLGCVFGIYIGIEIKHPDQPHPLSKMQRLRIKQIRAAGGIAGSAESEQEAIHLIAEGLREKGIEF